MGLDEANGKCTPSEEVLIKDENGEWCDEVFNYPSIIGMLLYLQGHTRTELTFAVSQCARFTFQPRRSHELSLKRVGRYLIDTRDKGMIIRPSDDVRINCYVDADFAGLWNRDDCQDELCAHSIVIN